MTRGNSDLVDLELRIVRDDPDKKAIAVVDGSEEPRKPGDRGPAQLTWFWLPRSQIEYTTPDRKGNTVVTLPEWLATEKGLV